MIGGLYHLLLGSGGQFGAGLAFVGFVDFGFSGACVLAPVPADDDLGDRVPDVEHSGGVVDGEPILADHLNELVSDLNNSSGTSELA